MRDFLRGTFGKFLQVVLLMLVIALFVSAIESCVPQNTTSSPSKVVPTSSIPTSISPTPVKPSAPPPTPKPSPASQFVPSTAIITRIPFWQTRGVLFYNGNDYWMNAKCTVWRLDAKGNYLGEIPVNVEYVPPKSHWVSMLQSNVTDNLTLRNIAFLTPPNPGPFFARLTVSDINLEPPPKVEGAQPVKYASILTGTLTNAKDSKPSSIKIQVLARDVQNGLTLAGDGRVDVMPPRGANVSFKISLWQNVIIKDAKNGIIDGEIVVLAIM